MNTGTPRPDRVSHPFQTAAIMRICLVVSLALHVILVVSFRDAFSLYWAPGDLRTYRVEMIRPPVEDLDLEDVPASEMDRLKEEERRAVEREEETISLETKDERYVSYTQQIKARIMRHWGYPPEARENLVEGRLLLVFTLQRSGDMIRARMLHSSGHEILDREALRAIGAASPYPSFPDHITVKRLHIQARFDYRIAAGRAQ